MIPSETFAGEPQSHEGAFGQRSASGPRSRRPLSWVLDALFAVVRGWQPRLSLRRAVGSACKGAAGVALLAVVVSGGVVGSTGAASATTLPSPGCSAANNGDYDRTLSAGVGTVPFDEIAFDTLATGERLLFTAALITGVTQDGGGARIQDVTGGFVFVVPPVGPTPDSASVVYDIPADGGRTFRYTLDNLSGSLPSEADFSVICLDGSSVPDLLTLTKAFTDDPAVPGGTTTLEFTIQNLVQDTVTGIAFTDDLDATLTGLVATGTPMPACGGTLDGASTLALTGGTLAAGASCTFSVTLSVPAGAFGGDYSNTTSSVQGLFGTNPVYGSPASDTLSIDGPLPGPVTTGIITGFIEHRGGVLADAGPTAQYVAGRFDGTTENGFEVTPLAYQTIPDGGGGAAFDALVAPEGTPWAIWLEGRFERYRIGGPGTEINGGVAMLQGGLDVRIGDNLILGVTAVGDGARELSDDLGYFVEGLGWMAGPYGALRLGDHVIFDAKFLWGQSWNDISPFLTYTDQFTTTRWLATARLAGEADLGGLLFRPEVYFAYFSETQAEYVDNNGITIPEQTVTLGRLTFGPEIAIPIRTDAGGTIEPRIAMEGVWDFTAAQLSARLNGGLQFSGAGGASLLLYGGYGGLFAPDFSNWNVGANITVPLQ